MRPALVRQHEEGAPAGLLADWLEARGIPAVVSRSWLGGPVPDPADHLFVVSLGSRFGPRDVEEPLVADELGLLRACVAADVPVLGLCFGGQALAAVLGGRIEPAPAPELGWREIETDDPSLVPPGPWLEWHFERFCTPPGATALARTADAPQAFVQGPHLGVQFHPESTPEIVAGWAAEDRGRLVGLGLEDAADLLAATTTEQREAAAAAAFRLFDAFLDHAGIALDRAGPAATAGGA